MSIAMRTDNIKSRSHAIVVINADFGRNEPEAGTPSCCPVGGSLMRKNLDVEELFF